MLFRGKNATILSSRLIYTKQKDKSILQYYHDTNLIVASSVSWQKALKDVCDCCPDGLMVRGSLSRWKRIVFHESVVRLDGK